MSESLDKWSEIQEFENEVLYPLIKAERHHELCEHITEYLARETDPEFRYELKTHFITVLYMIEGAQEECVLAAESLVEEFPRNPFSWLQLAQTHARKQEGYPRLTQEEKALKCLQKALEVARQEDEWVRYVLFDLCRALASMGKYDQLEAAMREIIEDLANTRRFDIPKIEGDWLRRLPRDTLDEDFVERYADLCHRSAKRWQELGDEAVTVPTLADLNKDWVGRS